MKSHVDDDDEGDDLDNFEGVLTVDVESTNLRSRSLLEGGLSATKAIQLKVK